MNIFSPVARISIGLVFVTLSILMAATLLTNPLQNRDQDIYQRRKLLLENLAIQYSALAQKGQLETLRSATTALVERNPETILSAALRLDDGTVLVQTSEHRKHWVQPPGDASTLAYPQVPILRGKSRWATLEVSFVEAQQDWLERIRFHPYTRFLLVFAVAAFALYWLYMRRTLQYLDPSAVIPERVKAAFDAVPVGIVLLDDEERIVLANNLFRERMGGTGFGRIGRKPSAMPWRTLAAEARLPWQITQTSGAAVNDAPMELERDGGEPLHVLVSTSPISDGKRKVRGVLVAFDDVTALDQANHDLRVALGELERSHAEIGRKNAELLRLATRDPLTACLNRRAFFELLEPMFVKAQAADTGLCCVMCDIDHFKRINDTYGHAVGDQVIQLVAETLTNTLRSDDLLCRYGGEEFCIIMPGLGLAQAAAAAERLRTEIEASAGRMLRSTQSTPVTASFGVSAVPLGARDPSELIGQADTALYTSKQGGRNRVTRFDRMTDSAAPRLTAVS